MEFDRYRKAVASILGAVGVVIIAAVTDNVVTQAEGFAIGGSGLSALLVYLVPNLPTGAGRYLKFIVSVLLAIVQAVALSIVGGLTASEVALIAVAALTAGGVYVVPNEAPDDGVIEFRQDLDARGVVVSSDRIPKQRTDEPIIDGTLGRLPRV